MAKTFDALKRAEKETGFKSGAPPMTPLSEGAKPTFSAPGNESRPEIPPLTTRKTGLEFSPEPMEEEPWPETPSKPPKLKKFKDISMTVEEYRNMKYKILNCGADRTMKTILFCSIDRGEGNSTALLHFGQTLAAEGYRVLLVDSNLRNPAVHRFFRLERENGLTDLCLGKNNLKNVNQVMKKTVVDNLRVITSGNSHANPVTIFECELFDALVEQMKMEEDWVLFDSPPLNSYSDSIALAGKVDGVVLVVQAEKTRWEVVEKAKERLEKSGAKILGIVLNKRRFHIPKWLYKRL